MLDLIISFIIQSKECKLADIGKFTTIIKPAKADIANKQMTPPFKEILFNKREEKVSDELVKYVAEKKKISSFEALSEIKKWCAETKEKLKNGEAIFLNSLGVLKKESSGNISFENQITMPFFAPVPAERVIHKNSEHAVLVGDRETTSSVMNQFYSEEETTTKSNAWKIIAIILLAIALVILFFYFYGHPFSLSEFGNHVKTVPQSPPSTYLNK
jgi:nucleoid DNA-binding protein